MNRKQRPRLSALLILVAVCLTGCAFGTPEEPTQTADLLRPLVYPASEVQTLAERGLTAETFAARERVQQIMKEIAINPEPVW